MLAIVTALPSEAKPLIEFFNSKFKRLKLHLLFIEMTLFTLSSGIGKINAALAVSYLQGKLSECHQAWLNVGIAGHQSMAIGTRIIPHKIIDAETSLSAQKKFLKKTKVT